MTKAFVLLFGCFCILIPQIISRDSTLLSSTATSRANRRLKGFTFKSLRVDSVVSCGLRCQRDSRCVSLNFVQTLSSDQGKIANVCELNERDAVSNSGDLEYDEESVYIQLFDKKAEVSNLFLEFWIELLFFTRCSLSFLFTISSTFCITYRTPKRKNANVLSRLIYFFPGDNACNKKLDRCVYFLGILFFYNACNKKLDRCV